jgi:glycolate oxidase iron-sulfur subunit
MNIDLFLALDVDFIVTDCAGCGCALKEYEELLEGKCDRERIVRFRAKIRDISEFLVEVGIRTDELRPVPLSVTYHEPCGMAGSFALKELETSRRILERKLANVRATGADLLVTANPGCHLQLAWGVRELGMKQPVLHIVELLGKALPQ